MTHKITFTRSLLAMLALNITLAPQQARASDASDVAKTVLAVAAAAAVTAGVTYGGYRLYEHITLAQALNQLDRNMRYVADQEQAYRNRVYNDGTMVAGYIDHADEFEQLREKTAQDAAHIRAVKAATQRDYESWRSTARAENFTRSVLPFLSRVGGVETTISRYSEYLTMCSYLLSLEQLMRSEEYQPYAALVKLPHNRNSLMPQDVRACYASLWPFKDAAHDLDNRVRAYESSLRGIATHHSSYADNASGRGLFHTARLKIVSQIIRGFQEHVDDLRAHADYRLREEAQQTARVQAEAARAHAHAAEAHAQAAQRQARADEERNHQRLCSELMRLRTQLSEVNIRIEQAATPSQRHNLKTQRTQLINEIISLKGQLGDDNYFATLFIGFVFDVY